MISCRCWFFAVVQPVIFFGRHGMRGWVESSSFNRMGNQEQHFRFMQLTLARLVLTARFYATIDLGCVIEIYFNAKIAISSMNERTWKKLLQSNRSQFWESKADIVQTLPSNDNHVNAFWQSYEILQKAQQISIKLPCKNLALIVWSVMSTNITHQLR